MKIEVGMKCKFKEAYTGEIVDNGIVICINENGTFTVCEDLPCPPQYNDSYTDFSDEDIGKTVFFEQE